MQELKTDRPELDPARTLNPYLTASRRWDLHVGDAVLGRTLWQAAGLLSLLIALTALAWAAHRDLQPKLLPYIIEVDQVGNAEAVRIADSLKTASSRNFEVALGEFVTLARRVTSDAALQRAAVFGVFAKLTEKDAAYGKYLQQYGQREGDENPNFPFERAKRETVATELRSVLQQTEETWEVEWLETVYDRAGKKKEEFEMRGLFQLYQASEQLTDEEAIKANPLGIYVRDYSWGRKGKREVHQ